MKLFIKLFFIGAIGFFIYNSVDDASRATMDNFYEEQMISLRELQQKAYLLAWSFFGAYDEEVSNQQIIYNEELAKRKSLLQKRKEGNEDKATEENKVNEYDKFLAK